MILQIRHSEVQNFSLDSVVRAERQLPGVADDDWNRFPRIRESDHRAYCHYLFRMRAIEDLDGNALRVWNGRQRESGPAELPYGAPRLWLRKGKKRCCRDQRAETI
ncbi:MAG: hypothetical protein WB615_03460 [Candidatus Tumulicola sp.]